ncbi:hypothetical protein [Streptomyces californicus]|uniref:hypothetical protein n=1 Tax=Streptomyces californicus TaxID=67351 RepID=UPI00378E0776
MRRREMLAFYAGIAVLLLISAFATGSFAQASPTGDAVAHSPAVSVCDPSGPNMPLEGVDGDATLQQRHKAGSATASFPVPAGVHVASPDLHDCAAVITRQQAAHTGSRSPVQTGVLRC